MKPLTLTNRKNNNRAETGMHSFVGNFHVVLIMELPDEEECSLGAEPSELLPQYFQVHCPQYQAPMIFEATKENLVSYWNWQADTSEKRHAQAIERLEAIGACIEQLEMTLRNNR